MDKNEKGGIEIGIGAALIWLGIGVSVFVPPLGEAMISAGAGLVMTGIGTLLSKSPVTGIHTTSRNPVAPWEIAYGRCRLGGTLVYVNTFGNKDVWLDLVIIPADHPCLSVDELLFNQGMIQIDSTTGTCNTSGTIVTQTSGLNPMTRFYVYDLININGTNYMVSGGITSTQLNISTSAGSQSNVPYYGGGSAPGGALPGSGCSFIPLNQNVTIRDIRKPNNPDGSVGNVITVTLTTDIPYLQDGDQITINNNYAGGILQTYQWTGTFPVTIVGRNFYTPNIGGVCALQFTYICAGDHNPAHQGPVDNEGGAQTNWENYGAKVYFEMMLGSQTLGTTFAGMTYGTPDDGDRTNLVLPQSYANTSNPWTSMASLVGKTAVFLRLHYDSTIFAQGIPLISFLVHGKNNVYDPRLGSLSGIQLGVMADPGTGYSIGDVVAVTQSGASGGTLTVNSINGLGGITFWNYTSSGTGYTLGSNLPLSGGTGSGAQFNITNLTGASGSLVYSENSALVIADYLTDWTYGFKLNYGTTVPLTPLISAANTCDEAYPIANPLTSPLTTEPRYTCNGSFKLSERRGEILSNLLTSCAGRLTHLGGEFVIWPANWAGVSSTFTNSQLLSMMIGTMKWRPIVPINQLFNGVKGTYISPANKWISTDFPPYVQDSYHGYNNGAPQYDYDANLTLDQGDRRWKDIQLPFTLTPDAAQRIAKIELLRSRQQGTGTLVLNMKGYLLAPMDVIQVALTYLGWTAQLLEVLAMRLNIRSAPEGGALMTVEIDVQTTAESVYDWDIAEDLSAAGYQQVVLPDLSTPAPPSNFLGTSENGSIFLSWVEPSDAFVTSGGFIEIEYQLSQSPEGLWISLGQMDPTVTTAEIDGLTVGSYYNIQIRSANAAGVTSPWETVAISLSPLVQGPILVEGPTLWSPGFVTPLSPDYLTPSLAPGFGIDQQYPAAQSGLPIPEIDTYGNALPLGLSLVLMGRREFVSGPFSQEVVSVSSLGGGQGIISFGTYGSPSGLGANVFNGRILSKLANGPGDYSSASAPLGVPICDFLILGNDSLGNFTVTPDPTQTFVDTVSGTSFPYVSFGDLMTCRTGGPGLSPGGVANPLTADLTSFMDPLMTNYYNSQGLLKHKNSGNLALVIGGTGAFQPPVTVVDNNGPSDSPANKVTVTPWTIIPDSSSSIVLVEANPQVVSPSNASAGSSVGRMGTLTAPNYSGMVVRIEAYTTDAQTSSSGPMGSIESVPFREIFLWGAQGVRIVASSTTQILTDGTILCNTSGITAPSPTTVGTGGISSSSISLPVVSGTNIVNNTYINVDSGGSLETMLVTAGAGTTTLTVERGQMGTTAVSHIAGVNVAMGGALIVSLLPTSLVGSQKLAISKTTSDINYIQVNRGGLDTFPGGGTSRLIISNTTYYIQFPRS